MLTIPHFIEFVKYLQNNAVPDKDELLNEILEKKDPWRSEWLDAYFIYKNDEMYIAYDHRLVGNTLRPSHTQKLEDCLEEEEYIDLMSANSQGLPTKKVKKQEIYYYPPSKNTIARFVANSGRADLYCFGNPSYADAALGVRAARPKN